VKPKINSVDVHPQVIKNKHPVDGVLVGTGSIVAQTSCFEVFAIL
jgi:hypothetical protein